MKKLKILLLFSCTLIFFNNLKIETHYSSDTKQIIGVITEYNKKENYTSLIVNAKEKVIVYIYDECNFKLGDTVYIEGKFELIESNKNFNIFNYQKYMLSKKLIWKVKTDNIKLVKENNNIFYKIKNIIKERTISNSYLQLFIIGENDLDKEIKQSYQLNGVSHLFAVSGMHITLFVTILTFILNKIIKNKRIVNITICLFLLFYMFLTGFTVSIVRASLFTIILNITKIFNLKINNKELLIYIFIICISYNPYYIYQVGFWFTYVITFSFLLFQNKEKNNYFIGLFKSSCLSFVVSIPILIYNFSSINFLSPILNLFFIPFITFIVFPLSIITFIFPILLPILEYITMILEMISLFCSKISFFTFTFTKIPSYLIILYYFFLYLILKKMKQKKYRYSLILLIILVIHYHIPVFRTYSAITVIDIGQGDSTLIELEHNKGNILLDTGGTYSGNQANNILIPYLKSRGIKSLDYLILTHGDYDHMGEAITLVNNFNIKKVILNCGEFNELEQDLIKVLDNKKIPYSSCIKKLNIGNRKLYFLNNRDYGNENDNSNIIYFNIDNYKFLFMGDAGLEVEEDLLRKYNLTDIDILKVGHHGSKTSSSKNFIDKINPKYSIISVGKNNRYGHPNNVVLENLEDSKIYRTDQDGSIMFKIKNNKLNIDTCAP